MQFKEVHTNDYLTKSNLPYTDYVINPYGGCTHACKYCYASFMKRFTGHTEEWGSFLDIYVKNDETYWLEMEREFTKYCSDRNIRYINAFYHSKLVKEKVGKS